MASLPHARRCALYTPGHTVHFIQARLAWTNPQYDVPAEFLGVEDEVISVVTELGTVRHFRNHELGRLVLAVKKCGPSVVLRSQGVLAVPHEGGTYCFCIKPDDGNPLDPCVDPDDILGPPVDPSPEQLARYLVDRASNEGGALVTDVRDARRSTWLLAAPLARRRGTCASGRRSRRHAVPASPLALRDLAGLLLDTFEATAAFHHALDAAGVVTTAAAEHVEFHYHFCGTSLVAETGKYGNTAEHPIVHREDDDE